MWRVALVRIVLRHNVLVCYVGDVFACGSPPGCVQRFTTNPRVARWELTAQEVQTSCLREVPRDVVRLSSSWGVLERGASLVIDTGTVDLGPRDFPLFHDIITVEPLVCADRAAARHPSAALIAARTRSRTALRVCFSYIR